MKRIEFVDALRGFTMLLVVFWHVSSESFGLSGSNSLLNSFFLTFRMPMFFFISGFIGYKAIEKITLNFGSILKRKSFCQLVPTAIIFSLFAFTHGSSPMSFFDKGLEGYWFTLVLFELFLIYYTLSYVSGKVGGGRNQDKVMLFVMVFLAIIGNILALWMNIDLTRCPRICIVLTLNNLCYYMQFFFLGIICRKYEHYFYKLLENRYFTTFIFVGFIVLFVAINTIITHDFNKFLYYGIESVVIKYFGLISLFLTFYYLRQHFSSTTKVGKSLQYIGRRTLDIYLLHYFFLPNMKIFSNYLTLPAENIILEIIVVGGITMVVVGLCLIISKVLRITPVLEKYLFGVFPKSIAK